MRNCDWLPAIVHVTKLGGHVGHPFKEGHIAWVGGQKLKIEGYGTMQCVFSGAGIF